MKRKFLCIMVLIAVLLTGCQEVESIGDDSTSSMFVEVETTSFWKVVYHKETKVMYAVSYGSYNLGTFTVLLNADGTPMLWDGEVY